MAPAIWLRLFYGAITVACLGGEAAVPSSCSSPTTAMTAQPLVSMVDGTFVMV